ncbi:O-antigen polymerase [Tenacibaculum geojense]|uniref:O-antigen polymerase n=1 Tax=Tenacibaculum geojense TaxID=915352 RepID=A0ABW3JVK0_9FLAO
MINFLILIIYSFIIYSLFKKRNKYTVGFIFSLFWFGNIVFSNFFFSGYKLSTELYLLLLVSSIFVFLGEFLASNSSKLLQTNHTNEHFFYKYNNQRAKKIFFTIFLFAFLYPISNLINNGISLSVLLSFQGLLSTNNELAMARYSGETSTSLLGQFFLVFVYLLPLFSGVYFFLARKKKFLFLALIPSLIVLLTQNTKLVFIACVMLLVSSFLITSMVYEKSLPKFKKKVYLRAIAFSFLFYVLLIFSFVARLGSFSEETVRIANDKVSNYVAHVPALDLWLLENNKVVNREYDYGVNTFFGFFNAFGIVKREVGIFTDFHYFESNGRVYVTNIYTIYRYLIQDFGILGSILFLFCLGFVFGKVNSLSTYFPNLALSVLSALLFFVLNSYLSSIFAYMSFILSFSLLLFLTKLLSIKKITQTK